MDVPQLRVLFLCLGNICRSPLAEGIFRRMLQQADLQTQVHIDSCGLSSYHIGELPDPRTRQTAARHGLTLTHRARQLQPEDFDSYDYILAMDQRNLEEARLRQGPEARRAQLLLLRSFEPERPVAEVPDPYFGDLEGFEEGYHLLVRACEHLLRQLRAQHGL